MIIINSDSTRNRHQERIPCLPTITVLLLLLLCSCGKAHEAEGDDYPIVELTSHWLWDPNATELQEWQILDMPRGATISPFNDIIIAESGGARLVRMTLEGMLIELIGREGSGPGEFLEPVEVGFSPNTNILWVVDPQSSRISRFTVNSTSTIFLDSFSDIHATLAHRANYAVIDSNCFVTHDFSSGYRLAIINDEPQIVNVFADIFQLEQYSDRFQVMYNCGTLLLNNDHIYYIGKYTPIIEIYDDIYNCIHAELIDTPEIEYKQNMIVSDNALKVFFEAATFSQDGQYLFLYVRDISRDNKACIYELHASSLSISRCYVVDRLASGSVSDLLCYDTDNGYVFVAPLRTTGIQIFR